MIVQIRRWKDAWTWLPTITGNASFVGWDVVPLSDFLARVVEPIADSKSRLQELNVIEKVSFGGELFVRTNKRKRDYRGQLFCAQPGDLIISKIRAAQGSLCLVPASLGYLAVSGEYPVYRPDASQIEPAFLSLLLRTPHFQATLRGMRSGNTGKARLRPSDFEALEIPLPDRKQQIAILRAYRAAMDAAGKLDAEARRVEHQGQVEFEAALGLTPPPNLPKRRFQVARYKDIERWSHEGILQKALLKGQGQADYPLVALGDVVEDIVNGWCVKCASRPAKDTEWAILKQGAVSFGVYDEKNNKAFPANRTPRADYEVKAGDVLISRCNTLQLVGACVYVEKTLPRLMLSDKIFRVVFRDESSIEPRFLSAIFKTHPMRQQIEALATGTSPTMKNISKPSLLSLTFPLPDRKTQAAVVRDLEHSASKAKSLRETAAKHRGTAWTDFISAIFS